MKKSIFNKKPIEEDLYKIKKLPYQKDDMHQLKELFNNASYGNHNYNYNSSSGKGKRKVILNIRNQRVTFKMSYSKTMASHKKYVENYLIQKEKDEVINKPELFGTDTNTYKENMDALNFKCIISPENQNVDLKVLSNEFISRLETLTGYKFYWQAAIHNNTAHKHVHICINGKDQNSKQVQFQKEWIRNTMREMLSYVTTEMVGERTAKDIEASNKHLPESKRWTKLDEKLEKCPKKIDIRLLNQELQNRLMFLKEIKLATKVSDNYYSLDTHYKEVLQATGRYNTFLENYLELNQNLKMYNGEGVRGIVTKVITFDKDESWNDAILIHTKEDKNVYIPIYQLHKDDILGKEIIIKSGTSSWGRQVNDKDIKIYSNRKNHNNIKLEY